MRSTRWVWSCALVLFVGHVETHAVQKMEDEAAIKLGETQRMFLGVETQLSAARQVAELFTLEDAQLELLALETRANMDNIRGEMQREMNMALRDMQKTKEEALANITRWNDTLQGLKAATDRNRRVLKQIRDEKEKKKEEKKLQEMEKIKQEMEKKEMEKLKEFEKLQQLEKQRQLEVQKLLEQEKREELDKQQEMEQQNRMAEDAATKSLDAQNRVGTVKRLLAWYMSAERTALDTAAIVYHQLVLPVVAILGLFLVLTVVIAKYNAMKQARRNRRVLYSGYPKSYRPQLNPEANQVLTDGADLRPRLRHTVD